MDNQYFHKIVNYSSRATVLACACFLTVQAAQAAPLELIYNGVFNTQSALNLSSQTTPSYFASATPFSINAWFDTASPNLAPPSPPLPPPFAGYRAFAPSLVIITIGGTSYSVETFNDDPVAGVIVSVFDQNSFTPGRYGIGIFQQPVQDGAGIVGDFRGASPDFTASNIAPTVFTGYAGVGYSSGVCLQGTGGNCSLHAVTPLVLHDGSNTAYSLTLGNYEEEYEPGPLNSAQLVATPEPGTCALAGFSLILFIVFLRRQRQSA